MKIKKIWVILIPAVIAVYSILNMTAEAQPQSGMESAFVGAESGSMNKDCAGELQVCDGKSACRTEAFSISATQYAYVDNGALKTETHTLVLKGALAQSGEPRIIGVSGKWVLYQGEKFKLAIPWNKAYPIYVQQTDVLNAQWQVTCS